jgi:hypothetical protein
MAGARADIQLVPGTCASNAISGPTTIVATDAGENHAHGGAFIGDTRYDSDEFSEEIKARGIKAVIHSKLERKRALPLDRKLYRIRYLVEVRFHTPKRFRAIGTRYDKTKRSYLALLHVACICVWLS